MLFNAMLPLAAATLASATKVVMVPRQVDSSGPQATPSDRPTERDTIGNSWEYYGCVSSGNRFPSFQPNVATPEMDLDFCAASCETKFFGVAGTTCYCADSLDDDETTIVSDSQCNTPCPGNPSEACGGELPLSKRAVPAGIILSVYERNNDSGNGGNAGTATITATVTETGTVTACPGTGDCTTGPYTSTRTVISGPGATCGAGIPGNVICYGSWCIFDSNCEACQNKRVVCNGDACNVQECGPEDQPHRLVVCVDDECKYKECQGAECEQKVVCVGDHCAVAECFGDECKKNLYCHGEECNYEQCQGDDCHKQYECQGEDCKVAPECTDCAPPSKPEVPVSPPATGGVPPPPMKTPVNPKNPEMPPFSGAGAVVPALMGVVAGFVALL